jgi:hypothetical protein
MIMASRSYSMSFPSTATYDNLGCMRTNGTDIVFILDQATTSRKDILAAEVRCSTTKSTKWVEP